ncbi:MAG: hypothetical protein Q8P24_01350 [Desulfobacterales bacterium]|nr:hypothetical protein [Desulfobacterales bacterium]
MAMDKDELREAIDGILRPEPDEDSGLLDELPPHGNLNSYHKLNYGYWKPFEFGSCSEFSRAVDRPDDPINPITQSITTPRDLLWSALLLFGDSIVVYSNDGESISPREPWGPFRYYPSILMTFWAGFEAYVRIYSELLVHLKPSITEPEKQFLLEYEEYLDNGRVKKRQKPRPLLDRYWQLLKSGYGFEADKGCSFWQKADQAYRKRNGLVHYEVNLAPALSSNEVWGCLESILLLLIWPSCTLGRSLMARQYDLYYMLAELKPFIINFEERPIHKGWAFSSYLFPCSFIDVDEQKYPSMKTKSERGPKK